MRGKEKRKSVRDVRGLRVKSKFGENPIFSLLQRSRDTGDGVKGNSQM